MFNEALACKMLEDYRRGPEIEENLDIPAINSQ